jgi:hypothetical protein
MAKANSSIHVKLNNIEDIDIIEFLGKQTNISFTIKLALRIIKTRFGNKDLYCLKNKIALDGLTAILEKGSDENG